LPRSARQSDEFECVTGALQERAERREPIAATDVIETFDQCGQLHGGPP
jgi:hypothetical protein